MSKILKPEHPGLSSSTRLEVVYIRILYHSFFGPPSSTAIANFLGNIRATTTICHPDDILSIYTLYLPDENRLSGGKLLIFVTGSPGPGDCEL